MTNPDINVKLQKKSQSVMFQFGFRLDQTQIGVRLESVLVWNFCISAHVHCYYADVNIHIDNTIGKIQCLT